MLGFPLLYFKGMRLMMFQLSGFYYKSNVEGIPALFDLYPISTFMGLTVLGGSGDVASR